MFFLKEKKPRPTLMELREQSLRNRLEWSAKQEYVRLFGAKQRIVVPIQLSDSDIILGFNSPRFDRDNAVTVDLGIFSGDNANSRSIRVIILGPTGTQKSGRAISLVYDNFVNRFKFKVLCYDPKREHYRHTKPSYELSGDTKVRNAVDSVAAELGMERRGYDIVTIAPSLLNDKKNIDIEFRTGYHQIRRLAQGPSANPDEAAKLLIELVNISDDIPALLGLLKILLLDETINTFAELMKAINKQGKHYGIAQISLDNAVRQIKLAIGGRVINDNPKYHIDILKLLYEHEGVTYAAKLKNSKKDTPTDYSWNATFKIVFSEVLYNNQAYYISKDDKNAQLHSPVVFFFDELSEIAPNNDQTTTKDWVESVYTKARAAQITVVGVAQDASQLTTTIFDQIEIILSSKVTEENGKALVRRGLHPLLVEDLKKLNTEVETNIGTRIAECFAIIRSSSPKKYLPIFCLCDMDRR